MGFSINSSVYMYVECKYKPDQLIKLLMQLMELEYVYVRLPGKGFVNIGECDDNISEIIDVIQDVDIKVCKDRYNKYLEMISKMPEEIVCDISVYSMYLNSYKGGDTYDHKFNADICNKRLKLLNKTMNDVNIYIENNIN